MATRTRPTPRQDRRRTTRRRRARRIRTPQERRRLLLAIALGVAVLVTPLAIAHQRALADFRQLEQDYIASRKPSACALQGLTPYAFAVDRSGLDVELERLVNEAAVELEAVRERFAARRDPLPWPYLRTARNKLGEALEAQRLLYDAMINDRENSDDEHERFRALNMEASVKIVDARRALFVTAGRGWDRRSVCPDPPPEIPPGLEQVPGP